MYEQPQSEHQWIHRLVGEWAYEGECGGGGAEGESMKMTGTESVRSLGGLWTIGEGTGKSPDGNESKTIMTLGYDAKSGRFVGTFIVSMMTHLWPYVGSLDATGTILTLESEGPSFAGDGTTSKYLDIIEFQGENQRTLSSKYQDGEGNWIPFMKSTYRRITSES
jgi:hypothetical protein